MYVGLRQLDTGTGVYDITGALGESMDLSDEGAGSPSPEGSLLCSQYSGDS